MSDYPVTSPRGQEMMSYLPDYYQISRVMRAIAEKRGLEFDNCRGMLEAILRQFYVALTDEWGLELWEKELNLPLGDSETKAERQQRVISKLRAHGTATIKKVKTLAESYDLGLIDIAEDYSKYTVIRFIDTTGVPSNLEDLKAIVREVIPAHLELQYKFNYFIWDELEVYQ
jgi:uncharacterized protein YmfQ (DUF2313 family)